jgi:hypothetical protein
MAPLVSMIKDKTPSRPVIYRSHIQIRSDLVDKTDSPQAEAWSLLWNRIQRADYFISHPVPSFVPKDVPRQKVLYVPGSTDLYVYTLMAPLCWAARCRCYWYRLTGEPL